MNKLLRYKEKLHAEDHQKQLRLLTAPLLGQEATKVSASTTAPISFLPTMPQPAASSSSILGNTVPQPSEPQPPPPQQPPPSSSQMLPPLACSTFCRQLMEKGMGMASDVIRPLINAGSREHPLLAFLNLKRRVKTRITKPLKTLDGNEKLKTKSERVKTFVKPKGFDVDDLVSNGFIFLDLPDVIKCVFCGIRFSQWKENGENPVEKHSQFSPNCPHVLEQRSLLVCTVLKQIKQNKKKQPPKPSSYVFKSDMFIFENRLKSLVYWPTYHISPDKKLPFCSFGLYFTGEKDCLCCVLCQCKIVDWASNDSVDPLEAHLKINNSCPLINSRGMEYDNEHLQCFFCLINIPNVLISPCFHCCVCSDCNQKNPFTKCPECFVVIGDKKNCLIRFFYFFFTKKIKIKTPTSKNAFCCFVFVVNKGCKDIPTHRAICGKFRDRAIFGRFLPF